MARGLCLLCSRVPAPAGAREAALGLALLGGGFGLTAVIGIVERPGLFAGLLYLKGGWRREAQLLLEAGLAPAPLRRLAIGFALVLMAGSLAGGLRHAAPRRRQVAFGAIVLGVVAFAGARLAARPTPPRTEPGAAVQPDILLVIVDSLRPQDLWPEEPGERPAAPALAEFGRTAVRFTGARTPVPRTYSSIASLMSGRHPEQHGVVSGYPHTEVRTLTPTALPAWLGAHGWRSVAVGGYAAAVFAELDMGVQDLRTARSEQDVILASAALRGHPLLPVALSRPWLRRALPQVRPAVEGAHPDDVAAEALAAWQSGTGPTFLTVFFDNPHLPYVPVWPESARGGDYDGPNRYGVTAGNLVEQVRVSEDARLVREQAVERDNVRRLHAAAVAGVDRAAARLIAAARARPHPVLVIVLADHGENLVGADGPLAHGEAMERDRSAEIPWMMSGAGLPGPLAIPEPVTVMDLAPTLAEWIGLPPLAGEVEGISLVPLLRPPVPGQPDAQGGKPGYEVADALRTRLRERPLLLATDLWFFARHAVDRLDPSGLGLAYPDFTEGLLRIEPGDPIHIVIAPEQRDAVRRARHRRLEIGPWSLTCLPRTTGPVFRLYRRDRDPWLTEDLSDREPEKLAEMTERLQREAERLGDADLATAVAAARSRPATPPSDSPSASARTGVRSN